MGWQRESDQPERRVAIWLSSARQPTAARALSLGADFDIGNLAGTVFYEFFVDTSATSGEAGSGVMDSGIY